MKLEQAEQAEQEPQHSEHYWQHEINNARADGYERGYVAAKKLYAEQTEQEPVAWMQEMPTKRGETRSVRMTTVEEFAREEWANPIPLYAAPVRTKDLTDEEILKTNKTELPDCQDLVDFARAVIAADREKNK